MPNIGDTRVRKEHKQVYVACENCGECRWVALIKDKPRFSLCKSCAMLKALASPETKTKKSISALRAWAKSEIKERQHLARIRRWENEDERERQRQAMIDWHKLGIGKESLREHIRIALNTPIVRERKSLSAKKHWSDKDRASRHVEAIARGMQTKPNIPETTILNILNEYFPEQWRYTGDGGMILGGLIPGFVNVNGKKAIIEVFGDYWHKERVRKFEDTEQGRIEAFAEFGYNTLILWEKDIKRLPKELLVERIKSFVEGEHAPTSK